MYEAERDEVFSSFEPPSEGKTRLQACFVPGTVCRLLSVMVHAERFERVTGVADGPEVPHVRSYGRHGIGAA